MKKLIGPLCGSLGPQGSLTGVDQVNIRIPRSLIGRGNADVVLQVAGRSANTVTITIK